MKGIGVSMLIVTGLLLAGCGGDNNTTFVLSSGSPSSSASANASASQGASASPGSSAQSLTTAPTPIANGLHVIIDSPDGSSPISSPVEVSGTASVTNGAVIVVVKDASGNELGRDTATASAAKPDYGHFDLSVTFSGATSGAKGEIRVMDAATQKNYYFITIRFA